MLRLDLLSVKVGKKYIYPRYISPEQKEKWVIAQKLLDLFHSHLGKKRGELEQSIQAMFSQSREYLFVRGLSKLLFDASGFTSQAPPNLFEKRIQLFLKSSKAWQQGQWNPHHLIEEAASELHLSPLALRQNLYADLKEEEILTSPPPYSVGNLIDRYNLALAQGVLLRAKWAKIKVQGSPSEYRRLFKYIKFFRLLFTLAPQQTGYEIHLDGPLSLFRSSTKYGFQLAQFLAPLVTFSPFHLTAEVAWGKNKKTKIFQLDHTQGLKAPSWDVRFWIPEEFRLFPHRFSQQVKDWTIEECDQIFFLDGQVIIPDFTLTSPNSSHKVYLEIFGYWRKKGLEKRLFILEKLPLIVAASEKLCVEKELFWQKSPQLYLYKQALLPEEILKRAKQIIGKRESP